MSKHTPGPWSAGRFRDPSSLGGSIEIRGDGIWIGDAHGDHFTRGERPCDGFPGNDEAQANARLIAAAPALVEALRDMIQLAIVAAVGNPKFQARVEHASALLAEIDNNFIDPSDWCSSPTDGRGRDDTQM